MHAFRKFPRLVALFSSLLFAVCPAFGGYYAYVANTGGNTVSVIDTSSDTVVASITTGAGPIAAAVNQLGTRVYVANTFTTTMTVIDAHSRLVLAQVNVGSNPRGVAVSPDGSRVYVAVTGTSSVAVVDAGSNAVIATVPVLSGPHSLVVSPDGSRVYVANNVGYNTNVTVIATATNSVAGHVGVGSAPVDLALNGDGTRLYVTNNQDFTMSVVDTTLGPVGARIATVFAGHGVTGVALAPDGSRAFVTRAGIHGNNVLVFDTGSLAVLRTIALAGGPQGIGVTPDGAKVYVGVSELNAEAVIDAATGVVLRYIPVGVSPYSFGKFIGAACSSPVITNVAVSQNPAPVTTAAFSLSATATNATCDIGGANYSVTDASGTVVASGSMLAADSNFDSQAENVTALIAPWQAPLSPGVYRFCVSATNSAGISGDAVCVLVAVYDPNGGFVTGGGWFVSAPGAYLPTPAVSGRSTFGFVSKYKKGASIPEGNTEFQFHTVGLRFSSRSYQWLVVNQNDRNAQFKGIGTVNGIGNFSFMIWAYDGSTSVASPADTFRIKIWDMEDNDAVLYDNGVNQPISGGNVIVHAAK
ncbi:MAG: YncE family protein [Opitutaceae bacterium]|nr:YncE family protein [Opitutaceae bacterium]